MIRKLHLIGLALLAMALFSACSSDTGSGSDGGDAGCTGPSCSVDAGLDGGPIDGGPIDGGPVDGGPIDGGPVDGGPVDGGPNDGGPDVLLAVTSNPNNVLSAIATVSSDLAASSVHVTYQAGSAAAQATPEFAVTGNSAVVPVLGLAAQTTYSLQAVVSLDDGGQASSPTVSFTSGTLPSGMVSFLVTDGGAASPGYTLIARLPANAASGDDYISIIDGNGTPVWYLDAKPGLVADFQKQPDHTYTVAQDDVAAAQPGLPESMAIFHQYDVLGNELRTWTAPPPAVATDCHELRIEPNGDALLMGVVKQTLDMSQYVDGGRTDAVVYGNVVDRLTPDGGLLFTWSTFDHISPDEIAPSVPRNGQYVDATHANSIDVTADGNYLVSLRDTSEVLKIDSTTGDVIWKLGGHYGDGGAAGDFTFVNDPLGGFTLQHAARELPNGDIILFDDGNEHVPPQSRAAEYALDLSQMTATLVWSAEDVPPLYAFALGYSQRLPNGNTLITYGTASHVQEVDSTGKVLWDVTDSPHGFGLYRAFRLDSLY